MNRTILFKKQIEILTITKKCIVNRDENHFFRIREGYFDLFFENQFNLKSELIEIIPTENISPIRSLIVTLKNAYNFSNETINATGTGPLTFEVALKSIDYLIDVLNAERNRISNRSVFYSWQNDRLPSTNRNFIENVLKPQ